MTRFMGNIDSLHSLPLRKSAIMAQARPNLLFFDYTMGYRAHVYRVALICKTFCISGCTGVPQIGLCPT